MCIQREMDKQVEKKRDLKKWSEVGIGVGYGERLMLHRKIAPTPCKKSDLICCWTNMAIDYYILERAEEGLRKSLWEPNWVYWKRKKI